MKHSSIIQSILINLQHWLVDIVHHNAITISSNIGHTWVGQSLLQVHACMWLCGCHINCIMVSTSLQLTVAKIIKIACIMHKNKSKHIDGYILLAYNCINV